MHNSFLFFQWFSSCKYPKIGFSIFGGGVSVDLVGLVQAQNLIPVQGLVQVYAWSYLHHLVEV